MVQINLLPVTAKKKRKIKVDLKIKLGPVIFSSAAVILVIILTWAVLGMRFAGEKSKLNQLDEQMKSLKFTLQKLETLKQNEEELSRKLEFIEQQLKRDILWGENLNRLSNLIPAGVWIKNIALHNKKQERVIEYVKLDIEGSAASLEGEEMINLIGGFMAALKKDRVFSKQFSEINLISSRRSNVGKIEVMEFKLVCQFR